jgi:hypothetical protein
MGGAAHHAIGAFEGGALIAGGDGREGAEEHTAIVPVERRLDIEARRIVGQHIGLGDGRGAIAADDPDRGARRAGVGDGDALDIGDGFAALGIILLDIPGVPIARLVDGIGKELIARTGQRFAAARLVKERRERAVGSDGGPENGVLDMRDTDAEAGDGALVARHHSDTERWHGAGACGQEASRERRIDDEQCIALPFRQLGGDDLEGAVLREAAGGDDAAELGFGVLIHFADGGAGQDVVELVLEHDTPLRLERLRRSGADEMGERGDGLGGDQRALGLAVQALDAGLGGERGAMQFEIDFAGPDRELCMRLFVGARKIVGDVAPAGFGQDGEIAQLGFALDHFGRGATAAIAIADGEQ